MNRLDRSEPVDPELSIYDFAFRGAADVARFAIRAPLLTGE